MSALSHVKSDTIGDFTGTVTQFNSQGSTATVAATDLVRPSDWNSVHNVFATISGNTSGSSTMSGTNLVYGATGGITLSASSAAGAATMWISGQGPLSVYEPHMRGQTTTQTLANSTWYFQPVYLSLPVTAYQMIMLQQQTTQSATTWSITASVSAGNATSATASSGVSGTAAIFSRQSTGTDAHSSNLISVYSNTTSYSVGWSQSVSWSTNASSATASISTSQAVGYLANIDSVGGTTSSSNSSSGSTTFSSTSTNANSFSTSFGNSFISQNFSGIRPNFTPWATSLPPNEYWIGIRQSTQSGTTNDSRLTRIISMNPPGIVAYSSATSAYAEIGNTATFGTSNLTRAWGSGDMNSVTSTTFGMNSISNMSNYQTYFQMVAKTN